MRLQARDRRALLKERLRSVFAVPHPRPLLIFGNQKSGTSAIAGLLGAASGLRVQIDFHGAREPYLTPLVQGRTKIAAFVRSNAWAFSAPIVKEPSLTFVATELLDHFGSEKGLFIVRSPYQNIRSILDRLAIPGHLKTFAPSPTNLPNRTWEVILAGSDLGIEPEHYVGILAKRWYRACEVYFRNPGRYVLVRYEDFNAGKKEKIGEIAAAFGLRADRSIDSVLEHPFQGRGKAGTDIETFFGRENLNAINEICSASLSRLGYDVCGTGAR